MLNIALNALKKLNIRHLVCILSCPCIHMTTHDMRHLKVFVVVIPKEGLAGFEYDTDYKILLYCLHGLYSEVGVIPKEGMADTSTALFQASLLSV